MPLIDGGPAENLDRKRTELTPARTVLVREWNRQSHRVMVLADGFAWNGQTYDSLAKVAYAITGTRWNVAATAASRCPGECFRKPSMLADEKAVHD